MAGIGTIQLIFLREVLEWRGSNGLLLSQCTIIPYFRSPFLHFKEYIFENVGLLRSFVSSDSIFHWQYIYLDYTLSNNRALLICSVLYFCFQLHCLF